MKTEEIPIGALYRTVMDDAEKDLISEALGRAFGNQSLAAKILGINRNTLRAKINKLSIDCNSFKI